MGQHPAVCPTTTGGTLPAHTGIAAEQATAVAGSHGGPVGLHWKVGQQSCAVPIAIAVPCGHTGAGVIGQAMTASQIGWQLTCAQQSKE